jgi:hypothetical protein
LPDYTITADTNNLKLVAELFSKSDKVIDLAGEISLGVHTGVNSAFLLTHEDTKNKNIEKDVVWSLLTGSDIDRYTTPEFTPQNILYVEWDTDEESHSNTIAHLAHFKDQL